jgi:hypothetical protein
VSRRLGDRPRSALLLAAGSCIGVAACSADVPIGSWLGHTAAVEGGNAGASSGGEAGRGEGGRVGSNGDGGDGGDGGEGALVCGNPLGIPGPLNSKGEGIGVTIPYTDWTWPQPLDELEWNLTVESTIHTDGYFWAHQFSFSGGAVGFVGLQERGGYQADPPDGLVDITNMVVFWISSSPLRAELGDFPYPEARTYLKLDSGAAWWTIHVRYKWQPCRSYRLRIGRESVADSGDIWYGAWIADSEIGSESFLGRILVPASFGQLGATTSTWSNRIGYSVLSSCGSPESVSAVFGIPSGNGGTTRPSSHSNRFMEPPLCPTSRITELPNGVRQELGLPVP